MAMPLDFYNVNTSLSAIKLLQETYGLELERLQTEDKGAIMIVVVGILQQQSELQVKLPGLIEMSSTIDQLYQQGGKEQVLALLRFVFDRL